MKRRRDRTPGRDVWKTQSTEHTKYWGTARVREAAGQHAEVSEACGKVGKTGSKRTSSEVNESPGVERRDLSLQKVLWSVPTGKQHTF